MDQLVIRYHRVSVTIKDQIAITHVDQVFHNPNDWTIEGTYLFPLPLDAAVSEFKLWIDGEPVDGEILEAEEARRTYEEIVRTFIAPNPVARLYIYNVARTKGTVYYDYVSIRQGGPDRVIIPQLSLRRIDRPLEPPPQRRHIDWASPLPGK